MVFQVFVSVCLDTLPLPLIEAKGVDIIPAILINGEPAKLVALLAVTLYTDSVPL